MIKTDYGLIFWIHLLVILAYLITPFVLGWQWIFLIVALFYLQNLLFKNCVLTKAQLDERGDVDESERSFYSYYFKKIGLKVNSKWVKKYFAYSLMWTVFAVSLIWQLAFNYTPYWFNNLF
ncbi:MAG: hypothetical protein HOC78_01790 [Candidatus Komeilibacteria bacterium]|nr:hypothetical protein [Candidatus Komeilibacteria bacterium]